MKFIPKRILIYYLQRLDADQIGLLNKLLIKEVMKSIKVEDALQLF
jgi:hypothetical protein